MGSDVSGLRVVLCSDRSVRARGRRHTLLPSCARPNLVTQEMKGEEDEIMVN